MENRYFGELRAIRNRYFSSPHAPKTVLPGTDSSVSDDISQHYSNVPYQLTRFHMHVLVISTIWMSFEVAICGLKHYQNYQTNLYYLSDSDDYIGSYFPAMKYVNVLFSE